jgi:hypothetical protein
MMGKGPVMQRFFFHVVNDVTTLMDEEGKEFDNLAAACRHARAIIGDIIADEIGGSANVFHLAVMIDDADHVRVANIKAVTNIVESKSPFAE